MSIKRLKTDPRCGWCCYNEPDGHCICEFKCNDCGKEFTGSDHSQEECIKRMKREIEQLKKQSR